MTSIETEIIRAVLTKQFSQDFFNILLINECLKVSNTIPDRETYNKLTALHAVHYIQMSPTLRKWLFETCINLFTGNGFNMEQAESIHIDIGGEWVKKFIL